mmetsp:Transcript_43671/g.126076  ORF Transcript_43671/g.126076 Transcript_43671/m.126076 type:complete len:226 (+) Transcript_43671:439-1116(+)
MLSAPDITRSPRAADCGRGSPVRCCRPTWEAPSSTAPSTGTTSPALTRIRSPSLRSEAFTSAQSSAAPRLSDVDGSLCAVSGLRRPRASSEARARRESRSSRASESAKRSSKSAPSCAWPMAAEAKAAAVMRKWTSSLDAFPRVSHTAGIPKTTKTATGPAARAKAQRQGSSEAPKSSVTVAMATFFWAKLTTRLQRGAPGSQSGTSPCACPWHRSSPQCPCPCP